MTRVSSALPIPALSIQRGRGVSLGRQVYLALRDAVLDGRLRAGVQLPSSRQLARSLGVSRNVVVTAFERLRTEGFIRSYVGSGSFVQTGQQRRRIPLSTNRPRTSRWAHVTETIADVPLLETVVADTPAASLFSQRRWLEMISRSWRDSAERDARDAGLGAKPLREAIADYVGVIRGFACSANDIMITSGRGQALHALVRAFADPGATVVVEDPSSPVVRAMYEAGDVLAVSWPVDDEGIVLSDEADPRIVHVASSSSEPFGRTMSDRRRHQLLHWAAKRNTLIVDYESHWFALSDIDQPALKAIDRQGQVIYVGSFANLLPHLDVGFVIASPPVIEVLTHAQRFFGGPPSRAEQLALASFIVEGNYARGMHDVAKVLEQRRAALHSEVARRLGWAVRSVDAGCGMTSIAWFREPIDDREVVAEARRRNVQAAALSSYYGSAPQYGLVIPSVATQRTAETVRILSEAIATVSESAVRAQRL